MDDFEKVLEKIKSQVKNAEKYKIDFIVLNIHDLSILLTDILVDKTLINLYEIKEKIEDDEDDTDDNDFDFDTFHDFWNKN